MKYLLSIEGFTKEIKTGFLLSLVSHDRPIHEIIQPNLLDQRQMMANHFEGMSEEEFPYTEFEATRDTLISTVFDSLSEDDKEFLLGVTSVNPTKHEEQLELLKDKFTLASLKKVL